VNLIVIVTAKWKRGRRAIKNGSWIFSWSCVIKVCNTGCEQEFVAALVLRYLPEYG
jgi:hypothetical protein